MLRFLNDLWILLWAPPKPKPRWDDPMRPTKKNFTGRLPMPRVKSHELNKDSFK